MRIVVFFSLLSLLALASVTCLAQTSTENYVRTETMLSADSTCSMKSVQYFDGIGRPTLSVATTGGGETSYALTTYDVLGREESRYLPVATDNSLAYKSPTAYQKSGKKALHGYEYRYDERGRVVKKILPGAEYIRYWYDNADRVVCMQDGVMRSQGKYRFTVYDPMGRFRYLSPIINNVPEGENPRNNIDTRLTVTGTFPNSCNTFQFTIIGVEPIDIAMADRHITN